MFEELGKINENLEKSNKLLALIEEHLRVPNLVKMAKENKKF